MIPVYAFQGVVETRESGAQGFVKYVQAVDGEPILTRDDLDPATTADDVGDGRREPELPTLGDDFVWKLWSTPFVK